MVKILRFEDGSEKAGKARMGRWEGAWVHNGSEGKRGTEEGRRFPVLCGFLVYCLFNCLTVVPEDRSRYTERILFDWYRAVKPGNYDPQSADETGLDLAASSVSSAIYSRHRNSRQAPPTQIGTVGKVAVLLAICQLRSNPVPLSMASFTVRIPRKPLKVLGYTSNQPPRPAQVVPLLTRQRHLSLLALESIQVNL